MNEQLRTEADTTIIILALAIATIIGLVTGLILAVMQLLFPVIPMQLVIAGSMFVGVLSGVLSGYAMRYVVATVKVFTAKKMRKIGVSTRGKKKIWYVDE